MEKFEKVKRLAALNSKEFEQIVRAAASSMGLSTEQVEAAAARSDTFQKLLSSASEKDVEKILSYMDTMDITSNTDKEKTKPFLSDK
jgi:hypothetical protein